jgi:hypothetical protein
MTNLKSVFAIALASLSVLAVGCGGGGAIPTPPSFGSTSASSPYFFVQTTTSSSGGSGEAWGQVSVTGYARPNTFSCDVTTDTNCIPNVGDVGIGYGALTENNINAFTTNDYGQANFYTDAQPGVWRFYASGPTNSNCPSTSASFETLQNSSDGSTVGLVCGSNPAGMVATPSSCYVHEGSPYTNTCTGSVTLTFPPPISSTNSLPVATALSATNYDSSGDNVAQASVTAASSTSVVVPMPTAAGTSYLVVQDVSGNVIGEAEFTRTVIPVPPKTCIGNDTATSNVTPDAVLPCTTS